MDDCNSSVEIYTAAPPSARVLAIAAKWAARSRTAEQFNFFSDISRASSDSLVLMTDAVLALGRAAVEVLSGEDEHSALEAREILDWLDGIEGMRKAGAAPAWSMPDGVMTIEQLSKE